MTNFYGYELELFANQDIDRARGLRSGIDLSGGRWLIVSVNDDPAHLVWVCAPISPRALEEVVAGRAAVADVLRHSRTGTVEVVTVDNGRAVPDRCLLCSEIPPSLLPIERPPLALAA